MTVGSGALPWWKDAVVYQVYPRSFNDSNGDGIGDLPGITARLDYLKALGVDVVWLSPHFDSPNADNGYDIRDYRQVMAEFGSMADFDAMLAGMAARGIKLIIDLVVNHSSDEHAWFQQSRSSRDNPWREHYIWRDGVDGGPSHRTVLVLFTYGSSEPRVINPAADLSISTIPSPEHIARARGRPVLQGAPSTAAAVS